MACEPTPNCEVMTQQDDHNVTPATTIDDLPNEMLCHIMESLNHSDFQIATLLLVSKRWNAIVDETLGVSRWVGESNEFLTKKRKWSPLSSIMEKGIYQCVVSNAKDETSPLAFRRPYLLKYLEFTGHICTPVFASLLMDQLTHLKSINLHVTSLSTINLNLDTYDFSNLPFLKTLEDLTVSSENFLSTHLSEYNMNMCFENIVALLRLQFTSLKFFSFTCPLFLDKEIEIFLNMMKFISNNVGTLMFIIMNFIYRWRISSASEGRRSMTEINEINDALLELNETMQVLVPTNLHTLEFSIDERNCVCPTSLTVRETLLVQLHLVKMVYMCWNYMPLPVDVMRTNAATLRDVRLTVDDLAGPIDGQDFTFLVNLTKLVLEADGEVEFDDIVTQAPRLKNASAFPKSLKTLDFRNIFVENSDAEVLAKDFPNLKYLILVNIGRIDRLGMTMSTLLWILRCSPSIRYLKVKGLNASCFDLWEKGETGGCPHCPEGLHLSPELCTLINGVVSSVSKLLVSEKLNLNQPDDGSPTEIQQKCTNGPFLRLNPHDRKLIRDLLATTNMDTKFIPLIKKTRTRWEKV